MGRLDAWLWAVRLYKTRSLATAACKSGHVRVNNRPVKPAQQVKPGDRVTLRQPGWERDFEVVRIIARRVGAPEAQQCYVDHSPPRPEYLSMAMARRDRGAGRPTKKERRAIDALRGRDASTHPTG